MDASVACAICQILFPRRNVCLLATLEAPQNQLHATGVEHFQAVTTPLYQDSVLTSKFGFPVVAAARPCGLDS